MNGNMQDSRQKDTQRRIVKRSPVLLALLVFILMGVFWSLIFSIYRNELSVREKNRQQLKINEMSNTLTSVIYRRQALLNGLAVFAETYVSSNLRPQDFDYFALGLQSNDPVIRAIQFFPHKGTVLVFPVAGNEAVIGRTLQDLIHDERPNVRDDVQRTLDSKDITLSVPYVLRQGGNGFVARKAVYRQDELLGIVVVILNLDPLLEIPGLQESLNGYTYVLQDETGRVFWGNESVISSADFVQSRVVLPEGHWMMTAVPEAGWLQNSRFELFIFLFSGLILSILLSIVTFMITRRQNRLQDALQAKMQELATCMNQLNLAIEATEIGFFEWFLQSDDIVHYSPEWKRQIGYAEYEINNQLSEWKSRVHPDDLEDALAVENACIQNYMPKYEIEFRLRHKDGTYRNILSRGLLLLDENGKPLKILGGHIDITKQKQNQLALSASERRFRGLAEGSLDIILLVDQDFQAVYINPAAVQLIGYEDRENSFRGRLFRQLMIDLEEEIQSVFSLGMPTQHIMEWNGLAGKLTLDWRFSPVSYESDKVNLVLALARDITAEKNAQDALRESEVHFRNLADSGQALVRTSGVNKQCDYFNKPWLEFTGRKSEQEAGFGWTDNIHPDDFQHSMQIYTTSFDNHQKFSMDYRLRRSDGVYRWIQDDGSPRYNSKGKFIGYIAHCLDITTRKQVEEELHQAQNELQKMLDEADENRKVLLSVIEDQKIAEEKINLMNLELERRVRERTLQLEVANKELEAFSYSVSHDLRSPLRGIDGWSLALLEDYGEHLDEQSRKYLNRIRSETERMSDLIDDLLRLSRITRIDMQVQKIDLSTMAREVVERLMETNEEREIEWHIAEDLSVNGDPHLLKIVLENLLANAVKFTGTRSVAHIELGKTTIEERTAYFIKDNGVGFDMAYAKNLFGVFQRMHRQSEFPGTGVGLATVQRIIHRHGGSVWAEASKDAGATFYFTLEEG